MNYRNVFRKLEENLAQIERTEDVVALLSLILERVVEDFHDDLGIESGRLYVRDSSTLKCFDLRPPR